MPVELRGQRTPPFTFMSAQQACLCLTTGANSLGTTGVKAARLIAKKANSSRDVNVIVGTLSHLQIFKRGRQLDASGGLCYLIVNDWPHRAVIGDGCRFDHGAGLRVRTDLHRFRFTSAKGLQAGMLREQIVLRGFNQENCSCFPTVCEKRFGRRIERYVRCRINRYCARICFVRSTTSRSSLVVHVATAAVGGSLHVSHLIHRL